MENGKMISRLKGPSITETEINMRGLSSKVKMSLMARVFIGFREAMYTQETSIMAGFMVMGPML